MFCFVTHKLATDWEGIQGLILSAEVRDRTFIVATKTPDNRAFFEAKFGARAKIVMWWNA